MNSVQIPTPTLCGPRHMLQHPPVHSLAGGGGGGGGGGEGAVNCLNHPPAPARGVQERAAGVHDGPPALRAQRRPWPPADSRLATFCTDIRCGLACKPPPSLCQR